jgi:hypothetical protein
MAREACPDPQPDCKYATLKGGCFSDLHHTYWPKRLYCGKIATEFRGLPENKQQICRREHDERHATEPIPEKPTIDEMKLAIQLSNMKDLPNDENTPLRSGD